MYAYPNERMACKAAGIPFKHLLATSRAFAVSVLWQSYQFKPVFSQDIAQHTRVTPNQRKIAMKKFVDNIYNNPTALEELRSWNLELDKDLLSVSLQGVP